MLSARCWQHHSGGSPCHRCCQRMPAHLAGSPQAPTRRETCAPQRHPAWSSSTSATNKTVNNAAQKQRVRCRLRMLLQAHDGRLQHYKNPNSTLCHHRASSMLPPRRHRSHKSYLHAPLRLTLEYTVSVYSSPTHDALPRGRMGCARGPQSSGHCS